MSTSCPVLVEPKPRILYILTNADLAGAPLCVLRLATVFSREFDVHVVVGEPGPLCEALSALGVTVFTVPEMRSRLHLSSDIKAFWKVKYLVRHIRPTIIHAHSSKAGLLARFIGRFANVPVVFTAHGWGFAPGTPLVQRVFVWLSEVFSTPITRAIVCVSNYDANLAKKYLPFSTSRLFTIHNGIPDTTFVARPAQDPVVFTMVARASPQKDHRQAIGAFAHLRSTTARLRLVGEGTDPLSLATLLGHLPSDVRSRIDLLGVRRDVDRILADSQVFVLLSKYEGLPLVIIEAMRAGLPVIASKVGGVSELVAHEESGYLVPRDDEKAATYAMQQLHDSPTKRVEMGTLGRSLYMSYFQEVTMMRSVRAIYQEILG